MYAYNDNGAMTEDHTKGMTVSYNLMNQPLEIEFNNTSTKAKNKYIYTAAGSKLKVTYLEAIERQQSPLRGATLNEDELTQVKTIDYVSNKIYEDGVLSKILLGSGYYDTQDKKYYFYVQDHLGNNRVVADTKGNVVQSTEYYPFGLQFADGTGQEKQAYKYNGKEFDQMHNLNWYDYAARQYDPVIPHLPTIDPLAEKYYSISPYAYVANNPMRYVDYRGDSISLAIIQQFDQANGTNYLNTIISDLQIQTGLTYSVDANGTLTYSTDKDGNAIISTKTDSNGNEVQQGSATARNFIMGAINHEDKVGVSFGKTSGVPSGTNLIGLSPTQISQFISGAVGVDSKTMGWGMTFLHELYHTQVGGGLSDYPGNPGPVETNMNIIRSELNSQGGNYGQRLDYEAMPLGFRSAYLPFNHAAKKS